MKSKAQVSNLRIKDIKEITTPTSLLCKLPITHVAAETVVNARNAIHDILYNKNDRLTVIVGPCSVHDPRAAIDYARRLKVLRDKLNDDLHIVMRVYFEKPRTTVGWKGLINDPRLDGSFDINIGLHTARKLLLDIANLGIPAATEFLDLISPQYVNDLIGWGAIGARTTESQVHREMASGLSCPVGFKNGTDGSVQVAIDAIVSSQHPHHFLSMTESGQAAIFSTTGNQDCHIILRGGNNEPNYSAQHIQTTAEQLENAGMNANIMIDSSHANSQKNHQQQITIIEDIAQQITGGDSRIKGVMLESHLIGGRQNLQQDTPLVYGQSITDACIGWEDTEVVLMGLAAAVRARRCMTRSDENQVA